PITGIKVFAIDDARLTTPLLEYDVTDADRTAHEKVVGGLTPNTEYQIAIYSDGTLRGWENYTTRVPLVSGDNVINLAGIENDSILADTLPTVPNGSVILLEGGRNYFTGGYEFDKSVTIMSGYSFTQALPHIDCGSNFNMADGAIVDSIYFKNISFSASFDANYIFNISNSATIGEIKYTSCRMHSLRGITRIKGGDGTIDKFTIDDCVADSINGYAVFYVDKDTWSAGDITLKNSTFSKCQYFLASRSNTRSITIESCTINDAPEKGRQMFRWRGGDGANDVTEGIKIYNTIWGHGWNMDGEEDYAVKGFEGLPNTNFDVKNTWATSQFSFSSDDIPGFPSFSYAGTTAQLWTDPASVDFSFLDSGFTGKGDSGDPRWREGL
ncbi:MAG TPA: DUF5123 domain-containing protein, partial [Sunxiuqinia sp.]|nr:DUF5123 domain-containing protein [Sunxiuqinia sp.]